MTREWPLTGSRLLAAAALGLLFGGCTTMPWDSTPFYSSAPSRPTTLNTVPVPAGFYRVNPGDTLPAIASAYGRKTQDIASWNGLPINAAVSPGEVLRVSPPMASGSVVTPPVGIGQNGAPGASAQAVPNGTPNPSVASAGPQPGVLQWPLRGPILKNFAPGKSNGIVIGGRPGDPVKAAATGRVVYAGSGIEAYGPLIIIKHDDSLITAYGQNSTLLVKEGDAVAQGQTIGEVGVDSRGVASIQFEVRQNGQPVDPLAWLPKSGG
ncbi:peptidoglycan DD-metalloendopeptidase family protein [Paraburkholderia sp. D15]|uniref:peptidoglycan DD-metalloendopeptidase family protein n=1 Tax=Paraburkholderia sp. D15 TaxID=2880218 RepID=UPI00247A183E|nr:peptidoglycan DD-metalloendopeptidase family protein [Paraburkholderia sp. D15]WGS53920.1 peptidoglycan DD-metalloendopeptidase family protein [Paraburkholderia sp. D15]WKF60542.1 Murein hydrolase activator NlpD [Paraburkholderia busanensis]